MEKSLFNREYSGDHIVNMAYYLQAQKSLYN